MGAQLYKSFQDELVKIASQDGETRANMADRAGLRIGQDYLVGGELASNTPGKAHLADKTAGAREIESETYKKYKRYREPAAAVMKGALPGSFVANLLGSSTMGKNPIRAGALIGGGLGLADWAASGKARSWVEKPKKAKKLKKVKASGVVKAAMMGSGTFTPGRAKKQSSAVGSFQDQTIHKGSPLRPTQMGHTFKIPSQPGQ